MIRQKVLLLRLSGKDFPDDVVHILLLPITPTPSDVPSMSRVQKACIAARLFSLSVIIYWSIFSRRKE